MKRAAIAAAIRANADAEDARALECEARFANASAGSAAASCAPAARRRAQAYREQADHVEAGTWLDYLESIGRLPKQSGERTSVL